MTAFGYGILGLALGIYMAAIENHGQMVTHTHIMLVGFVVSFIYAVAHRSWLSDNSSGMPKTQYILHQVGTAGLVTGLYLLYGRHVEPATIGPILGIFSIIVLVAFIMMKVMLIKATRG